jgi:predicted dehydrogenase
METTGTVSVAIVGAGGIAAAHISAARSLGEHVSIGAVIDPHEEAARRTATETGATPFSSCGELWRAIERGLTVDALIVCTPPSARVDIVRSALDRGIAVLAEKPLAHTIDDAVKLADLARAHPEVASGVGYCHRFTPAILEMRRRLEAGQIGRLTRFENVFATYFPALAERWMSDPDVSGGGSFLDTGSHAVDLYNFLVGPGELVGIVVDHEWANRGESSATALLRSRDRGVAGVIMTGWLEPDRFTVRLIGTNGSMSYDYLEPTELRITDSQGRTEAVDIESHEVRFARQLEAFIALASGGARRGLATFADGLAAADIAAAAARFRTSAGDESAV